MRWLGNAGGLTATAVLALVLPLAGCAADPVPDSATPSPTPTPSVTPTEPPAASERVFELPADCESAVPPSRLASLAASGRILLGGPGGKHGDDYLLDDTPEEDAGGITCIWGYDATDASSITISVAPLGENRPQVVQNLLDQGLNEVIDGELTMFAVQGDEDHAPAILNVLRADSWISVIQTVGGPAKFDEAITVADEVASAVYVSR